MSDLRKAAEDLMPILDKWKMIYSPCSEADWDKVEALRQALAQPEQYDQTALELCEKCGWKAIIPDEGCLVCARNNQKPVAWMFEFYVDRGFSRLDFEPQPSADNIPLYTAPPKREWVDLTEEEIRSFDFVKIQYGCEHECWVDPKSLMKFAKNILQAAKEKNA